MAVGSDDGGLVGAIKVDLRRFHDGWMELLYPRQRDAYHTVLGKWKPKTRRGRIGYRAWASLGAPIVALLYPLVLLGFVIRYHARAIDGTAARLGLLGVILVSVVIWGALTVVAHVRFSTEGFLAVFAAGVVATVSAALAVLFTRIGGRTTTVLLAYPFGMNALFLPPVVAAFYSPALASVVFPGSETVAIWILDTLLHVGGINEYLRAHYTLEGVGYVAMWTAVAVPLGWVLGILVTLADVVRPKGSEPTGSW